MATQFRNPRTEASGFYLRVARVYCRTCRALFGKTLSFMAGEAEALGLWYGAPCCSFINWLLRDRHGKPAARLPTLRVNSILTLLQAAESGLGIGALPDYLVENSTSLVRVLPEVDGPNLETFFVYPEELRHSKRITVFRDFLLERVKETRF